MVCSVFDMNMLLHFFLLCKNQIRSDGAKRHKRGLACYRFLSTTARSKRANSKILNKEPIMANFLFSFENLTLHVEYVNNEPWFIANEICNILEFTNSRKAIADHIDPKDVTKRYTLTEGGKQLALWINESGMYALIFESKLPSAIKFKRWFTFEVLPAIRKTGRYDVVSRSNKPARSSGAVYVQKASPVVQAPAIPPLMRPLDRPIRSDSGSYYEVWELWHRKIYALGLVPDWSSGTETAAWLHVFQGL